MMKRLILIPAALLSIFILQACSSNLGVNSDKKITKAEIRQTEAGHRIFLDGEEFYVKGAGVEYGSLEVLAKHGANAFRTWRTDNGRRSAKEVLDEAEELGLKVMMGIDVGRERLGFDYNDEAAVQAQLDRIKAEVLAIKDHPALIVWGIGNELNHHAENPKVWDAVNDISEMIHELDPYHLTTTPIAGMNKDVVSLVKERASDLDFLSVQMYGEIEILDQRIRESSYTEPLLVTEWGATGYWEVGLTDWGAPLENNSSVKADFYRSRYAKAIESQSSLVMGSFVFLWGQKQERTPTWFGMFMPDGNETEAIDAMHYVWNGSWPENRSPRLINFTLNGQVAQNNIRLKANELNEAQVEILEHDQDSLNYTWTIMEESVSKATGGDREEVPEAIEGLFQGDLADKASFLAPTDSGAYRLFIEVKDGQGHTAHANIPFYVEL